MEKDALFAGLNDIPWADLSSAFGDADELPIWIRRLASDDASVREDAAKRISYEVQHQGTLYTASPAVMPFLIRLLHEPSIKDKNHILRILGAIAFAFKEWEQAGSEEFYDTQGQPSSLTTPLVSALLPEVLHAALPLVGHEDVAVRMQAAQVLSCFPQRAPDLVLVLRGALERETDNLARINFLLALGKVSQGDPEDVALFERFLRDGEEVMRFAAAQSLARVAPEHIPQVAAALLVEIFASRVDKLGGYWELPCGGGWLWHDASNALYHLKPDRLQFAVPRLIDSLVAGECRGIESSLVSFLLRIGFGGEPPSKQEPRPVEFIDPAFLDALRRAVLALGRTRVVYSRHAFERYGLPADPTALASFLGIEFAPEPEPASQPARRAPSPFAPFSDRIRAAVPGITIWRVQRQVDGGQNNDIVAMGIYVGDTTPRDVIFRFPKHPRALDEMERELRLLHALQGKLPLPIPDPIYSSLEQREVGQAFMGYERLPGKPLYCEMLESVPGEATVQHLAEQLGAFLRALHTLPVDEVFDSPLPVVADRETWARMYADIREKLFPRMRPDVRESVAAHFDAYLDQPGAFDYTPTLIHGDFGASNILYDAKRRTISGILDWSSAGLGDPAIDIAALICPASYGEEFAVRLAGVYPGVADLLPRARFYIGTFALQEALFGVEVGDEEALHRGLEEYV